MKSTQKVMPNPSIKRDALKRAPYVKRWASKMKSLTLFVACFLSIASAYGEVINRLNDETSEAFAKRQGPAKSELAHAVIETKVWNKKKSLVVFYEVNFSAGCEQRTQIVGYLFEPMLGSYYKKTLIGHIEPDGGNPKIESVFFANADNDSLKELIVIVSWEQLLHADYGGIAYSTLVFHAPESDATTKLTFNIDISKKLDGGCDCEWSDGRKSHAKFKTAAGVKARLKALGY